MCIYFLVPSFVCAINDIGNICNLVSKLMKQSLETHQMKNVLLENMWSELKR